VDLGCDPVRAFVAVTLPLILPAIAAGWMLTFTLSLDDPGPGSATLPIRIYSEMRLGVKLEINAICTLVIGLIAVVILVASLTSKLSSSRGESPRHCSSRHCVRISPHPRSGRRPCSA
jgi:putrescine transport system permease protein